jgi:hypothetical protein
MVTKLLNWPYVAKEARDRSAEEAAAVFRMSSEIIEATNDPEVMKKAARIIKSSGTILRFLESQGAKTRPE